MDDGDEIVCLRVVDKDSKISGEHAMQERLYRQEAEALLEKIIEKNEDEKAISIILEFAVGKVHETIQRMVGPNSILFCWGSFLAVSSILLFFFLPFVKLYFSEV